MKEYFLKIWGGAMPYLEKNLGIKNKYYYFETKEKREEFIDKIMPYSKYGLAIDTKDGIMTHKRTIAEITLKYENKIYKFDCDFGYEYPEESALFIFEEGNYSCDCNKSLFIKEYCDEKFKEFPCGEEIELVNINIR